MSRHTCRGMRIGAAWAALVLLPGSTLAQGRPDAQQAPPTDAPLVLEPIKTSLVVAPEYKVTDIDGSLGSLVGGSAGVLVDSAFFVGGAGYWLANQPHDIEMGYGGLLVGWSLREERRFGFGARTLVGVGRADLTRRVNVLGGLNTRPFARFGNVGRLPTGAALPFAFTERATFFVAEPQATVSLRLSGALRLDWGVGYRFVSVERGIDDRLRGATGTIAIRFGGGS